MGNSSQQRNAEIQVTRNSSDGIIVRVADTVSAVEDLRPYWANWKGHRDSDIDFFLELIRTSPGVERPYVMVSSGLGKPDAILVGRLERIKFDFKVGYLHLPSLPVRALLFSYGGFRGNQSEENTASLVKAIVGCLRRGDADIAMFHQAEANSPLYRYALDAPGMWCRDHTHVPAPHHFMTLSGDFEEVLQRLSKQHRSQLRGINRKFPAAFEGLVDIRCFRGCDELEQVIPQIEEIAKKTYQRGLSVGFKDTPVVRERLRLSARKGWLRAYVLYVKGRPCSFWIGTVNDGTFCSDYLAFDPEFSEHSPGTYLQLHVIEDLCRTGVRDIDFGAGPARYKERFGNLIRMESNLYVYAPRPKAVSLNVMRTFMTALDRNLKTLLERLKLLALIKRLWRGRAAQATTSQA